MRARPRARAYVCSVRERVFKSLGFSTQVVSDRKKVEIGDSRK